MDRNHVFPLLLLPVLAACGGSEGASRAASSPAPSVQLSASTLDPAIKDRAEAICADARTAFPAESTQYTSVEQVRADLDTLERVYSTSLNGFQGLNLPSEGEGGELRRILVGGLGGTLTDLRTARSDLDEAIENKDEAAFEDAATQLSQLGQVPVDPEGVLASAGLPICADTFG